MSRWIISCLRRYYNTETMQAVKKRTYFYWNYLNFVMWYRKSPFYIKGKTKYNFSYAWNDITKLGIKWWCKLIINCRSFVTDAKPFLAITLNYLKITKILIFILLHKVYECSCLMLSKLSQTFHSQLHAERKIFIILVLYIFSLLVTLNGSFDSKIISSFSHELFQWNIFFQELPWWSSNEIYFLDGVTEAF